MFEEGDELALSGASIPASFAAVAGFGLAGSVELTMVSNELGAENPNATRLAVHVALFIVITVGILIASTMIFTRESLVRFYSNEKEIVKYVALMLPLVAITQLLDGFRSVLSGVPIGVLFSFVFKIGGKGLWLGIICGLFVQCVLFRIITMCTNWEQQAKKAIDRVTNHITLTNMDT
ncbi:hypothetical protein Scep_002567 [Stephania cephalantha]|uniref:MATE efflux family protein n=1 Tax=Stephania cephalantha TaxID=152367 RepID=A0AAP0LAE6_9MAGN